MREVTETCLRLGTRSGPRWKQPCFSTDSRSRHESTAWVKNHRGIWNVRRKARQAEAGQGFKRPMTTGLSATDEAEKKANAVGDDLRGQSVALGKQPVSMPRSRPTARCGSAVCAATGRSATYAGDQRLAQGEAGCAVCSDSGSCHRRKFVCEGCGFARRGCCSDALPTGDWPSKPVWVQVVEPRKALALAGANFFGRPANSLKLVGITGTNGKTTTSSLVDSIVKASGVATGLFETSAYHTPRGDYPAPNTTQSVDLQEFFAEVRDAGGHTPYSKSVRMRLRSTVCGDVTLPRLCSRI